MALNIILTIIISFLVTAGCGRLLIPALRRMKAGQQIREIGPNWHMTKAGTPTMGGIMFIVGITVAVFVVGIKYLAEGYYVFLIVWAMAVVYGAIGFADDYVKVKKKRNLGLTAPQKFVLQLVVACAFLGALRLSGQLSNVLYIPFFNVGWQINWIVYIICAAIYIVGMVNAVNLTDGIDGLATGVTLPVSIFFIIMALVWKDASAAIFPAALLGGMAAFLIYNFNPAKAFMGDTGSLFLGGAVVAMAFALDVPLALIPVGIVYLWEMLSVVIQVCYFKLTHGKRVFRMSPYHHHLEMGGWSEKKIFTVFLVISVIGCALGYVGVMFK